MNNYFLGFSTEQSLRNTVLLEAPSIANVYSTTDTVQDIFFYARMFKTSY